MREILGTLLSCFKALVNRFHSFFEWLACGRWRHPWIAAKKLIPSQPFVQKRSLWHRQNARPRFSLDAIPLQPGLRASPRLGSSNTLCQLKLHRAHRKNPERATRSRPLLSLSAGSSRQPPARNPKHSLQSNLAPQWSPNHLFFSLPQKAMTSKFFSEATKYFQKFHLPPLR